MTWAKLTEVNIELKRYNEALLTLNSCPMFTYNERDLHRMPTPQRTHLPVKQYITESGILASLESSDADNEADLALIRLPAPSLRGTFKKAYELLAKLVSQIGWDELLRTRSEVFVMEEEYRIQKQMQEEGVPSHLAADSQAKGESAAGADDDASVRAVREGATPVGRANGLNGNPDQPPRSPELPASPIPEIRISEHGGEATPPPYDESSAKPAAAEKSQVEQQEDSAGEREGSQAPKSDLAGPAPGVEKPATMHHSTIVDASDQAAAKEGANGGMGLPSQEEGPVSDAETQQHASPNEGTPSFTNKRLCERWLDNLFMVLYEVGRWTSFFMTTNMLAQHEGIVEATHFADRLTVDLPSPLSTGSEGVYDLASRDRALQSPTPPLPKDGDGVGDPGRPCTASAPPGRGKGRVPTVLGAEVLGEGVDEAARVLRG